MSALFTPLNEAAAESEFTFDQMREIVETWEHYTCGRIPRSFVAIFRSHCAMLRNRMSEARRKR